jgi:hypothetical protein
MERLLSVIKTFPVLLVEHSTARRVNPDQSSFREITVQLNIETSSSPPQNKNIIPQPLRDASL